ncbi:unnamed protein product, partial [marine sediment metagenome]
DIPFKIVRHIYLPAVQNIHSVFLFTCKNADLGFVEPIPTAEPEEKKKEEEESSFVSTPIKLQARNHIFMQFKQLDGEFNKEIYVPFAQQVDGASYDADAEEMYSAGYPLPSGKYLLAMAVTSQDLTKIGTQYFEFTLPDALSFTDRLETTPIFFARNIIRIPAAETTINIHKNSFIYSVLDIEPNMDNVFSTGDVLDIFYYIFGARTTADGAYDIDITYNILKGEEVFIRFAPQKVVRGPIISLPLPIKRTV